MIKNKNIFASLSVVAASFLIVGCSSGGSKKFEENYQDMQNDILTTGKFIDSPVEGLDYTCGDISGTTNDKGEFDFKKNCTVNFKVGGVNIGSISGADINSDNNVLPADLLGLDRTTTNTEEVLKITRFLQSIDDDGSITNTIKIDNQIKNLLSSSTLDLTNSNTDFSDINMELLAVNRNLVSSSSAISHYEQSLSQHLSILADHTNPNTPTLRDGQTLVVNGEAVNLDIENLEVGSKLYVNDNLQLNIQNEMESIIFPLQGADGQKSFELYVEDTYGNKSQVLTVNIIKDSISPSITSNNLFQPFENQNILGTITATDTNTLSYNFDIPTDEETYYEQFEINSETGEITFVNLPDYETLNNYSLKVKVSDGANITTETINVLVQDDNEDIPKLANTTFSVNEQATGLIGKPEVVIEGSEAISGYTINNNVDDDSNLFTIDSEGNISTTEVFDYETKKMYSFEVFATNLNGDSSLAKVTVNVNNTPETKPELTNTILSVSDGANEKTVVGSVDNVTLGDTDITKFTLTGLNSNHFDISFSGEITVANEVKLNADKIAQYVLTSTATNSSGDSNPVTITINVE